VQADSNRAHGVDALRGIAASLVVVVHATYILPLDVDFHHWHVGFFVLGVPLFFIISAFSMSLAYPDTKWGARSLSNYAIRRYLRIAPLFYIMLIAWLATYIWVGGGLPSLQNLFLNVTFLFGFLPGSGVSFVPAAWSLGLEMIFYALFPLLLYRKRIRGAAFLLLIALLFSFLTNDLSVAEGENYYFWTHFATNAPYFAIGLLMWSVYNRIEDSSRQKIGRLALLSSIGVMSIMFWYGPVIDSQMVSVEPVPIGLVAGWGLAFGLLVLSQALHPSILIVNPVTRFLGKISYSLYLMHPLLIWSSGLTPWAAGLTDDPNLVIPVVAIVTLAVAVPIAYVLYAAIEAPFISLARSLTSPRHEISSLQADMRHS
jgi:peptidoglycan/LPS O-acetylase OafA/YrhL